MRITSDRNCQKLTNEEAAHLASCKACQIEQQKLELLSQSAQHLKEIPPPNDVWAAIKPKKVTQRGSFFRGRQLAYGLAASVMLAPVIWMIWHQTVVQQRLEQVLVSNMLLEEKLHLQQHITFRQASLIEKLQLLDEELMQADSTEEKLDILVKRRELIQQHILNKKEPSREISI